MPNNVHQNSKEKQNYNFIFFYFPGSCAPRNPRPGGFAPWSPTRGATAPWTPLSTPSYPTTSNFKKFQKLTFPKNPGNPKNKANFVPKLTPYIFLRYIHYCEINFYFSFRRNNYLIIFLPLLHL